MSQKLVQTPILPKLPFFARIIQEPAGLALECGGLRVRVTRPAEEHGEGEYHFEILPPAPYKDWLGHDSHHCKASNFIMTDEAGNPIVFDAVTLIDMAREMLP